MATTNYTNRKIDVMMTIGYQGKLSFKFSNKIVAGIQKLVQMFLLRLFTAIKSNIVNPGSGTYFARDIKISNQYETGFIYHRFAMALTDVINQLKQNKSDNLDENLSDVRILEYSGDKDKVNFKVELRSEAGTTYEFIIPVSL